MKPDSSKDQHARFIELLKTSKFSDLIAVVGYDMVQELKDNKELPFLFLTSGRAVNSTYWWNPLVYAFVFDHLDIVRFFESQQGNYDFRSLFSVGNPFSHTQCEGSDDGNEQDLELLQREGFHNFLTLLIENFSVSLFVLLDSFYYLIGKEEIIHIISTIASIETPGNSARVQQVLVDVFDSQAFKSIFQIEVHSSGYESFKHSFKAFFEMVLYPVTRSPALMKKFEDSMCKTPFNSSFGIYLYLEKNDHSVFMEPYELLKSILSNGIRDYDIFRLFEYTSDEVMKEMENAHI